MMQQAFRGPNLISMILLGLGPRMLLLGLGPRMLLLGLRPRMLLLGLGPRMLLLGLGSRNAYWRKEAAESILQQPPAQEEAAAIHSIGTLDAWPPPSPLVPCKQWRCQVGSVSAVTHCELIAVCHCRYTACS